MLELTLQIVLVVLLLVSIGWSALLHRRLAALRQGGDGIGAFVARLVEATGRAEAATRQMREISGEFTRQWQRQRAEAERTMAELARLVASADEAARRPRPTLAAIDPLEPGNRPATPRADAPAADTPADVAHERIRRAIRDLR